MGKAGTAKDQQTVSYPYKPIERGETLNLLSFL
jgi:hypothetical protein